MHALSLRAVLALALCAVAAPAPPSWTVTRDDAAFPGVPYFAAANGDKDGSLVAARLAGAARGVSDTRALAINVSRRADAAYADDVGDLVAGLYAGVLARDARALLRADAGAPLVVGSVHRAALYVAEALHARLLNAQVLEYADTLAQACDAARGGDSLVLAGADGGFDGLWLWVKPARAAGVPRAHVDAMQGAGALVVVRATDEDAYLGVVECAGGGALAIHPSLKAFADAGGHPRIEQLWGEVAAAMVGISGNASAALRQWEWGLPDDTVAAYQDAWASAGGLAADVSSIEFEVVAGYAAIPRLWAAYLALNGVAARGVTVESYWIAQPTMARADAALPFPAYAFWKADWHPLFDNALTTLAAIVNATGAGPAGAHSRAFVNGAGSDTDAEGVARLWAAAGVGGATVVGYDCPPGACADAAGRGVACAHAVAAGVVRGGGAERAWGWLGVAEVVRVMGFAGFS